MQRILIFIGLLLVGVQARAFEIKGKVKLSDEWQPHIYLAAIETPANLFVSSPEFMINEAPIAEDGSFSISGTDLPADPRYYRLYLVKTNLYSLDLTQDTVRNYMHLLLDNSSQLELDGTRSSLFSNVVVSGSDDNKVMNTFEQEYFKKRNSLLAINTTAKRNFQTESLNRDIREFVLTCDNPMVGLFALYHIDDKETDFLRYSKFYFDFQDKLAHAYPKATYTGAYEDLVNSLVGYRDLVCEIPKITKPWRTWIIWGEAVIILILALWIVKLKSQPKEEEHGPDFSQLLTEKEQVIWRSLASGKTNKEIAAELFIELSTVKTHINNLYKRLGVTNRKEAITLYNQQK